MLKIQTIKLFKKALLIIIAISIFIIYCLAVGYMFNYNQVLGLLILFGTSTHFIIITGRVLVYISYKLNPY